MIAQNRFQLYAFRFQLTVTHIPANCLNIKFYASKILLDLPSCLKKLIN